MVTRISGDSQHQLTVLSGESLPSPEVLEEYERILPGATKIILDIGEENMRRRFEIERRDQRIYNLKSFAGLIFGFLMGIFGLGGGFYLTLKGYNILGMLCTSSTLVTLVMAFVYGSQSKRNGYHRNAELTNKH